ncbi:MAG: hydantoinase/oxoprolinase family protein, partial [Longimicrobiales bacterium]|nr:hydantoinase/oxoprolinase family protein [Longimicrobiales bacterium]
FGVKERVDYNGVALTPLDEREIARIVQAVKDGKPEAVAISLLFSFRNPEHEARLREALDRLDWKPFLSVSSEVLPEFREYERTSTVVVNAFVGPVMKRYLDNLSRALGRNLRIMQSSGGSVTAALAARQPVRTILSGPAGGAVGAFYTGGLAGHTDLITLDMGGTSTDVSLFPGRIKETTSSTVEGYPISVPMIEIHTVGAGGGSIARVDAGGALRVGPQSAGADPGPACYGVGDQVTVTDANLVLGRLQAEHFLGGRMKLDASRSQRFLAELAARMGADVERAALGIIRVVNSNMERAVRNISLERGYDPRQFTLLPFGGAGPMHACDLARELGIPRVLVPPYPGILSALGAAIADIVKDYSQTVMLPGKSLRREALDEAFARLEAQARGELSDESIPTDGLLARRALDVRYVGQSYELTVDFPNGRTDPASAIARAFHRAHRQRFGYADPKEPMEVVNLRLKMVAPVAKPAPQPEAFAREDAREALIGRSRVVFQDGAADTPLYLRERLRCGNRIAGPALALQMDSTVVIPPGWSAVADAYRNLILTLNA